MAARGSRKEMGLRGAVVAWNDALKLGDMVKLGLKWRGKQQRSKNGGFGENPNAADPRWWWRRWWWYGGGGTKMMMKMGMMNFHRNPQSPSLSLSRFWEFKIQNVLRKTTSLLFKQDRITIDCEEQSIIEFQRITIDWYEKSIQHKRENSID